MSRLVFRNASVFDGHTSHLLENYSVVVEDGTIVELKPGDASVASDQIIDAAGRTLMPGLIDLHTHPSMNDVVGQKAVNARVEFVAIYTIQSLYRSLMAGFTTLRDAGGTDPIYVRAIESGLIESPRLFPAGRFLTMTGGHGDMRDPDGESIPSCCGIIQDRFVHIADGAEEVRKAARDELRKGATHIKMFVSGGVMSPTGSIDQIQYTEPEIRAAVETAEARSAYVIAHCHPDGAIRRAAECGVRSIEHCSFISDETAALMVKLGTYAVPTLAVGKGLSTRAVELGLPKVNADKIQGKWEPTLRSMEILRRNKVKVGLGTDVCGQLHDTQTSEFALRAEIFTSYEILVQATTTAAEIMRQTGKLGIIAPGAHADIILVNGDPLKDVRILAGAGANIPFVMKAGRVHKNLL